MLVGLISSVFAFAQETAANSFSVEMAEEMRGSGKIYVVVTVLSIIFLGLAIFLVFTDRRVRKLEKQLENNKK